jgi:hypothetical protein
LQKSQTPVDVISLMLSQLGASPSRPPLLVYLLHIFKCDLNYYVTRRGCITIYCPMRLVRNPVFDKVWGRRGADSRYLYLKPIRARSNHRSSTTPPPRPREQHLLLPSRRHSIICVYRKQSLHLPQQAKYLNGQQSRRKHSVICRLRFLSSCRPRR